VSRQPEIPNDFVFLVLSLRIAVVSTDGSSKEEFERVLKECLGDKELDLTEREVDLARSMVEFDWDSAKAEMRENQSMEIH
tara:strand:- start:891 stop:1133 length:243 start_codon:yes stop_codon:yes gene_type:complete